jgi:acyl carrier protein
VRSPTADEIRALVLAECAEALAAVGADLAAVPDDFDLRAHGVIDSLGFLELITALEERLGAEIDFEALDPAELTVVGPLSRFVAAQVAGAAAADPSTNGLAPISP